MPEVVIVVDRRMTPRESRDYAIERGANVIRRPFPSVRPHPLDGLQQTVRTAWDLAARGRCVLVVGGEPPSALFAMALLFETGHSYWSAYEAYAQRPCRHPLPLSWQRAIDVYAHRHRHGLTDHAGPGRRLPGPSHLELVTC